MTRCVAAPSRSISPIAPATALTRPPSYQQTPAAAISDCGFLYMLYDASEYYRRRGLPFRAGPRRRRGRLPLRTYPVIPFFFFLGSFGKAWAQEHLAWQNSSILAACSATVSRVVKSGCLNSSGKVNHGSSLAAPRQTPPMLPP